MTKADAAGVLTRRAAGLIELHRPAEALELTARALTLDPNYCHAHCVAAQCHLAMDAPLDAKASAGAALAREPNSPLALRILARAFLGCGESRAALRTATAAVEAAPQSPDAHNLLAEARLQMPDIAGALVANERALQLAPNDPRGHSIAGLIALADGDLRGASRQFHAQLRLNPNEWSAHNNLGVIAGRRGNDLAAARHYFRGLCLRPRAFAENNLIIAITRAQILLLDGLTVTVAGLNALLGSNASARAAVTLTATTIVAILIVATYLRTPRPVRRLIRGTLPKAIAGIGFLLMFIRPRPHESPTRGQQIRFRVGQAAGLATMTIGVFGGLLPGPLGYEVPTVVVVLCSGPFIGKAIRVFLVNRLEPPPLDLRSG